MRKRGIKDERLVVLLLATAVIVYSLYFSFYQIQYHEAFWTGLDTVSVEQPIWNTLHGRFMRTTYYPFTGETVKDFTGRKTESLLADHVQPILLVLAVPYALVPRTETLLVLMSVSLGLGAIPFYCIARRRLGSPWWGLFFAAGYLLLPVVETNSGWDIHGTVFLPPLLLAALDAAERNRRGWWWLWTLLAMGCREDVPFLAGWAMLWLAPRERRREALTMFVLGLSLSLFYFLVVIPHFGGAGTPYLSRFFPPRTEMSFAGISSALKQPAFWQKAGEFFITYNARLGLPLLFLYWLHPSSLLAMLPMLLLNGLSWYESSRFPELFHYSASIVSWALVGTVEGFAALERALIARKPTIRWRGLIGEALAVSIVATHFLTGYTPLSRGFVWPEHTGREPVMKAILKQIPPEAPISTSLHLAAHVAQRETLRLFPDLQDAEWVAVDFWFGGDPYGTAVEIWQEVLADPDWEAVEAHDGLVLLRRGQGPPEEMEKAFRPPGGGTLPQIEVQFGEVEAGVRLRGATIHRLPVGHFILCTEWTGNRDVGATPWVEVRSPAATTIPERPLDGTQFVPALFARLQEIRECTQLLTARHSSETTIRLFVKNEEGQPYPVSILDPGAWEGHAAVEGNVLILHIPTSW